MRAAQPGRHNAITDVAGVLVGHVTRDEPGWLTGVSVVVPPPGSTGGVDVRPRSVKGGIRSTLAAVSTDAAMVVVGNRGRGGFRSKALGSVTMDLLKRAQCPVLVVHAT